MTSCRFRTKQRRLQSARTQLELGSLLIPRKMERALSDRAEADVSKCGLLARLGIEWPRDSVLLDGHNHEAARTPFRPGGE